MENGADARNDASGFRTLLTFSTSILSGLIYYFSNPKPSHFYDYTFRVAGNMLHGSIAFTDKNVRVNLARLKHNGQAEKLR